MGTISINRANEILRRQLGSGRWYFEQRGDKIWFMEELHHTYNRIFFCFNPDGTTSRDLLDYHLNRGLSFVRRRRRPKDAAKFDKRGKVISGQQFDDKEGKYRGDDELKNFDSVVGGH